MTATLAQIRSGLDTRLATISGLNHSATWPNQINVPMAFVKPDTGGPILNVNGIRLKTFEILVCAASFTTGLADAQAALDAYLDDAGTNSIMAAIDGDHTLGGVVTSVTTEWNSYGMIMIGDVEYFGAKILVTVWP